MKEENEQNEESFQSYEDELISLINKLSSIISTFSNLSREQAEKAILETNLKLNNCKDILEKMEKYIQGKNNIDENEKKEFNVKILNYKSEYHEILNKFKGLQDNYINKKTENALLDDHNVSNLIEEENTNSSNKNDKSNKTASMTNTHDNKNSVQKDNKNVITINKNNTLDNNKNLGFSLEPNSEKEEAFNQINDDYVQNRKKSLIICTFICIFSFVILLSFSFLSQ